MTPKTGAAILRHVMTPRLFTFSKLGRLGRFGNQLFQIAATIGMATRHQARYIFPTWEHGSHFQHPLPQHATRISPDFVLVHVCFRYRDVVVSVDRPCVIDLYGHFQSERYFLRCAHLVRTCFEPHATIRRDIAHRYKALLHDRSSCIVVVRRGDYALLPDYHPMQPAEYYSQAMAQFDSNTTFVVTSDDIAWCREHIHGPRVLYLPQEEWIQNFFVGTLCQHAIISNTTFGWWIAWLNKNPHARVFAPRRWFGPLNARFDTRDLLPARWSVL